MAENKIKQAEVREIMRSEMTPAAYNPRKITPEAKKLLKDNLKRVGLLGGIIWNEDTGNIVSGHQRVSVMDEVNRYDPVTGEHDYPVTVSVVHFDDKTEKEQLLFANNRNAQGEYDDNMLREMLDGIDYNYAGFDDFDIQMLGLIDEDEQNAIDAAHSVTWRESHITGEGYEAPEDATVDEEKARRSAEFKEAEENTRLKREKNFYEDSEDNQLARHAEIQKIKDRILRQNDVERDGGLLSYIIVSFQSPSECAMFCQQYGIPVGQKYISGKDFVNMLEFGDGYEEDDSE
jgi:hypothetical protein